MEHTTVPVGNAGDTCILQPSVGRSPFQTQYAKRIAATKGFQFFCAEPVCDIPYKGPFMLTYYLDGKLHADRVGVQRVLRKIVA